LLKLAEQVEAEGLRREKVIENPGLPEELALVALGIEHLSPDNRANRLGQVVRERVLGRWHREPRSKRVPLILSHREPLLLAPETLHEASALLEGIVGRHEDLVASEKILDAGVGHVALPTLTSLPGSGRARRRG
jgi:hypothetical protein